MFRSKWLHFLFLWRLAVGIFIYNKFHKINKIIDFIDIIYGSISTVHRSIADSVFVMRWYFVYILNSLLANGCLCVLVNLKGNNILKQDISWKHEFIVEANQNHGLNASKLLGFWNCPKIVNNSSTKNYFRVRQEMIALFMIFFVPCSKLLIPNCTFYADFPFQSLLSGTDAYI